jgi:hypothetical protein
MSTDLALLNSLADLAARINAEHEAITAAFRHGVARAFVAGELLNRAKSELPHGAWLPWLKANCPIPQRTCQLYMRLAEHREEIESANLAHLTIDAATRLLNSPTQEHAEVIEEKLASVRRNVAELRKILSEVKTRLGDEAAFQDWCEREFPPSGEPNLEEARRLVDKIVLEIIGTAAEPPAPREGGDQ